MKTSSGVEPPTSGNSCTEVARSSEL